MRGAGLRLPLCTLVRTPTSSCEVGIWRLALEPRTERRRQGKKARGRPCVPLPYAASDWWTPPSPVTPPLSKKLERLEAFTGITAAADEVKEEPSASRTAARVCWVEWPSTWRTHVSQCQSGLDNWWEIKLLDVVDEVALQTSADLSSNGKR